MHKDIEVSLSGEIFITLFSDMFADWLQSLRSAPTAWDEWKIWVNVLRSIGLQLALAKGGPAGLKKATDYEAHAVLYTDASLTGCGAMFSGLNH